MNITCPRIYVVLDHETREVVFVMNKRMTREEKSMIRNALDGVEEYKNKAGNTCYCVQLHVPDLPRKSS